MKASDLFARCLEKEGVAYVFALPGEENLDLLESLRNSQIKVIVTRHEQAAAFMAATYGRLTGKPGVCLTTLGPGATNAMTGVAHAQLGGMPMLLVTGQKGIRENLQANFQVIDVVNMMRPITKRTVQIASPREIPAEIRTSFKICTTERQGVCHIELPEDIAREMVEEHFRPQAVIAKHRRPIPDPKAIAIAADLIKSATFPIMIVSSRAHRNLVQKSLRKFCDTTNIYVIHTQLGKGVLPADHNNALYAFGIHKKDYVNCVVDKADLIITLGYATKEHPPSVWNKSLDKKILHIDFSPAESERYYNPVFDLVGDISHALDGLREQLKEYTYDGAFAKEIKAFLEQKLFREGAGDEAFPLRPRRIIADVRNVLGREDILCLDNGIYKMWFSRHYRAYAIGTFLLDNALATMGAGLPSAISAKLVHPKRKVLLVVGDGGFMMNSQELETAVRLHSNIVILLLNDNAFGFIKWKQKVQGFPNYAMDVGNPDFKKYAESYGAVGLDVNQAAELKPMLERAFNIEGPVLIHCPIDYAENSKVWSQELETIRC